MPQQQRTMSSSFHLAVLALAACLIAYAVVTLRRLDDLEHQMRLLADVAAELADAAAEGSRGGCAVGAGGGASFLASAPSSSGAATSGGCATPE